MKIDWKRLAKLFVLVPLMAGFGILFISFAIRLYEAYGWLIIAAPVGLCLVVIVSAMIVGARAERETEEALKRIIEGGG